MTNSSSQAISLHIEELVLHGFAHRDRDTIGMALQQELTRLFAEQGLPRSLPPSSTIPSLNGGFFTVTNTQPPRAIGHSIAHAIYNGLSTSEGV